MERLRKLGLVATEGRKLIGAAVLNAASVRAADLELSSDEPPERHAVIRNWPWDESDPILQKAKQKEIALTLASASGRPVIF